MRKTLFIIICILFTIACTNEDPSVNPITDNPNPIDSTDNINSEKIRFPPDLTSNLSNPATGWKLYEEGWSFTGEGGNSPEKFWKQMEAVNAPKYANILYIRMKWKEFEPEEGKYAWIYNEKYKWYIRKAKEHGLKLAFRVFHDGGVPEYVYKAGAKRELLGKKGNKQPYYDNPVFLAKFTKFIEAFGKEYNNPDVTDYVDIYGLGKWGEGHSLKLKNWFKFSHVVKTVTGAYNKSFNKVLTVMNLSLGDYPIMKSLVFEKLGALPRRDGIGSYWFSGLERRYLKKMFPKYAFIGEGAYWFAHPDGNNDNYTIFTKDRRFKMNNFRDALTVSVKDALENHSNTLDLRVPLQCKFWIEKLPEQVQKFITEGGYRFHPEYIDLQQKKHKLSMIHSWRNIGVGKLPNNHPNWNYKYQISFALLDNKNNVVYNKQIKSDPGTWLKGKEFKYKTTLSISKEIKGSYTLSVGITDKTRNNLPGIDIAVAKKLKINKWVKIKDIILD